MSSTEYAMRASLWPAPPPSLAKQRPRHPLIQLNSHNGSYSYYSRDWLRTDPFRSLGRPLNNPPESRPSSRSVLPLRLVSLLTPWIRLSLPRLHSIQAEKDASKVVAAARQCSSARSLSCLLHDVLLLVGLPSFADPC